MVYFPVWVRCLILVLGMTAPVWVFAPEVPLCYGTAYLEKDINFLSLSEFGCLRRNLYYEARNQGRQGMKAVAAVTINRTLDNRFPDTVCEVVYQRNMRGCQFSWTCDGVNRTPRLQNIIEREAWDEASDIAARALLGIMEHDVADANFYHANYVNPSWSRKFERVAQVGDHIFYRG